MNEHSALKIITGPTLEPVTVTELKEHLRLDTGDFDDYISVLQSIAPGSHTVAANYSLIGSAVDVLNYNAIVVLNAGTCSAGSLVDVKIKESDDNITFTDWANGSFSQISTANDNTVYEKEYTGGKQYIQVVSTVAVNSSEFSVDIIKASNTSAEDSLLSIYITAARRVCEAIQNRAYITQTWEYVLEDFPDENFIELPLAPLQSVTSVKYYGTDNTEYTLSSSNYSVDTYTDSGRVVLNYGEIWPTEVKRTQNGVVVRYIIGYGNTASSVPEETKLAIKLLAGHYYEHREDSDYKRLENIPFGVKQILSLDRIYNL